MGVAARSRAVLLRQPMRSYRPGVSELDDGTRQLARLVEELVGAVGAGAADVAIVPVNDLWSVDVSPHRSTAAPIHLLMLGDEVSGLIGRAPFYASWGDDADAVQLREIVAMAMLGRVEERGWVGDPALRVQPLIGQAYVIGAFSLLPWWLRPRRTWEPYDASVTDHGESLRSCPGCGHTWSEHPGTAAVPDPDGACSECEYEAQHGFAPTGQPLCHRPAPPPP